MSISDDEVANELLPCPFCGGTTAYVQNAGWQANTFIRCPSCDTTFSLNKGPRPHEASVAAWNRRGADRLQEICSEFGVRGGENRIDGIHRVLTEMRAALTAAAKVRANSEGDGEAVAALKLVRQTITIMRESGSWDAETMTRVDDNIGGLIDQYIASIPATGGETV